MCNRDSIVVETVDKKVRAALSAVDIDNVDTVKGNAADDARRERLAAVLWARHTAEDCEDEWEVLDPALQDVLKKLYPLPAKLRQAGTRNGRKRLPQSCCSMLRTRNRLRSSSNRSTSNSRSLRLSRFGSAGPQPAAGAGAAAAAAAAATASTAAAAAAAAAATAAAATAAGPAAAFGDSSRSLRP